MGENDWNKVKTMKTDTKQLKQGEKTKKDEPERSIGNGVRSVEKKKKNKNNTKHQTTTNILISHK